MTDKELRKEILERAYRYGARYVARDLTGEIWERAYFKQYVEVNIDPFIAFADGRTSWSKKGMVDWHAWKYCKLAEVNDENKL